MRYACLAQNMSAVDRLLSQLEDVRYRFGPGDAARTLKLLNALAVARFPDELSLIRFHEALLFLRAFPHSPAILRNTENLLNSFHQRVEALRRSGADMSGFDPLEVSGIAGTSMEDTLSFDLARWLVHHAPRHVEIAWDSYDPGHELGTTGPRLMPLLEDDAYVEADTPWRRWLETASGLHPAPEEPDFRLTAEHDAELIAAKRRKDRASGVSRGCERDVMEPQGGKRKARTYPTKSATAVWLMGCFERLPLPDQHKAELYDSLRIPLRWHLGNSRLSRTRNWKTARPVFYHDGPLISRSQVSLGEELARRPPQLVKLSAKEGMEVIDLIREVMLVRYRELYGTTLGDPRSTVRADVGRGVSIYLWNLPPDRRLPLRAYVAGLTLKNGVPINYIEAIGLCEWMEVGFNTFYTFRGGEAGWIYVQILRCLCHLMGTTVISVYPYQLGHDNEEAIESGAFWFYHKLGFRPGRPELKRLVEQERKKIAASQCGRIPARPYRTPPRVLKRLAAGHVFYELPGSEPGAWDNFSTRNIGLRVNQRMARQCGGDADRVREQATRTLERILGVKTSAWTPPERLAFQSLALVLNEVRDLPAWTAEEKAELLEVIRAKAELDEMLYLHRTQSHRRFRSAVLKVGSSR